MRLTLVAATLFALLPLNTKADDLLSCVDPEIVRAFLWADSGPRLSISDEFPQEFADISFPNYLRFIGSSESPTHKTVAFRADQDSTETVMAMNGILSDRGYRQIPKRERTRRGFQQPDIDSQQYLAFCNTDGQIMSVTARSVDGSTYLSLSKSTKTRNRNCNQQTYADDRMIWGFTGDLMPDLIVPDKARVRGSGHGGMIMSSGDDADTHVRIQTDSSSAKVIAHFADQLVLQGWSLGASWAGDISLGSTWMLSLENLPQTFGTLQLIKHAQGDYTLVFLMRAM